MRTLFLIALLMPTAAFAVEQESLLVPVAEPQKTEVAKPAAPAPTTMPAPAAKTTAAPEAKAAAQPTAAKAPAPAPAAAAAEAMINDFPTWAVSKAGSDTTGETAEAPTSPSNPASPGAPASPATPATPDAPKTPPSPASVTDKLWPRDTVPIFMRSCTGLHVEYMAACMCTITKLMVAMPHDEFLKLSADGTLDDDKRIASIRGSCLAAPGEHKE